MEETTKGRIKRLGKTQRYLASVLHRSDSQINQALSGSQPTLLRKIETHLNKIEPRITEKQLNNN